MCSGFVDIQNKREIGYAIAHRDVVEFGDFLRIELSRRALVNGCRIEKTVRDHTNTALECGENNLIHQLSATRLEEKQFCHWGHPTRMRRKLEKITNRFANGSAAWFPRHQK